MITLTAKIDILPSEDDKLNLLSDEPSKNRISNDLVEVFGKKTNYDSPFFLGASNFGGGEKFTNENIDGKHEKEYFVSEIRADENGDFSSGIYIVALDETQQMTSLTIAFDTQNNRHPTKINIDGVEYTDDDAIFTVGNLTPKSSHSITITDWNTPNYPIVITGIYSNVSIEINSKNLISLETSLYDRSDLNLPSFGIISNNGNIEFNDYSGEVRDYAEQRLLQSGLKCDIILKNTLVENAEKTVAVFETDKWNYNNEEKTVSVSLKDDLEEWQNINVTHVYYKRNETERKQLSWWYKYLHDITTSKGFFMISFDELDEKTKSVLNSIYIDSPYLNDCNLWSAWDKVCKASLSHIYKNSGKIIFKTGAI